MMGNLINGLKAETNMKLTENGGLAYKSSLNPVLDLFALGGAYRTRDESDCISLFQKAFRANEKYAMKCLFYLRDIRGGQGERRFFRIVLNWLAKNEPDTVRRNMAQISNMGRWDDYYCLVDTSLEKEMFEFLGNQLILDMQCETPSLLGKWLKSENASSKETKILGFKTRESLRLSHKSYRKILTKLRTKINVLEKLMSEGRWEEIEFDKIPSKAGFKYRNAFARRDIIAKKYEAFTKDENTEVNAKDLFVHEIVHKAIFHDRDNRYINGLERSDRQTERAMINKYWKNVPDYFEGNEGSFLCMCDTSGSMAGSDANSPIFPAIALSMYCAERLSGPYKDHFLTFSSSPSLVEITGIDFVDKASKIYKNSIVENTNLESAFDLVLTTAQKHHLSQSDLPNTIVVLSDMEIDNCTGGDHWSRWNGWSNNCRNAWTRENADTMMESMRKKWNAAGYEMPKLVFWNLQARQDTFLQKADNTVSFVSGFSTSTFKSLLSGKSGVDLMLNVLDSDRYAEVV